MALSLFGYDALFAFGDSLTDTGRKGPDGTVASLYFNGRYSNGPLWVEYLSQRLGLAYNASNNLAQSGAQTDDTYKQVTNFVANGAVDSSLFVVWAGGNDFLQEYDKYWFNDAAWDSQINYSVGSLSNAVMNLIGKGARTILIPNTVDVTRIPIINVLLLPAFDFDYLREKVMLFNSRLFAAVDKISDLHPEVRLVKADMFNRLEGMIGTASLYGFTDTTTGAIEDPTLFDKSFDGPGSRYLFWDPIHPTTKAHALVADYYLLKVAPLLPQMGMSIESSRLNLVAGNLHLGKRYMLEQSSDFQLWRTSRVFIAYNSLPLNLPITNTTDRAFFRVK